MNTDGPHRPLARVRRARGGRSLPAVGNVRQEVWEFNVDLAGAPIDRAHVLVRRIGRRWGWPASSTGRKHEHRGTRGAGGRRPHAVARARQQIGAGARRPAATVGASCSGGNDKHYAVALASALARAGVTADFVARL